MIGCAEQMFLTNEKCLLLPRGVSECGDMPRFCDWLLNPATTLSIGHQISHSSKDQVG